MQLLEEELEIGIGDDGIFDDSIRPQSRAFIHESHDGDVNRWTLASMLYLPKTPPIAQREKAAIYGDILSAVETVGQNFVDAIGVLGQGGIATGNRSGRVWGGVFEAGMTDETADGLLIGVEIGANNKGSVNTDLGSAHSKLNLLLSAHWNKVTTGIQFGFGPTERAGWHYGIAMQAVEDTFVRMERPWPGATGLDMKNHENWGKPIILPNARALYAYDQTGVPKNLFYLSSNGTLVIGTDAESVLVWGGDSFMDVVQEIKNLQAKL